MHMFSKTFTLSISSPYSACLIHMYTLYIFKRVIITIGLNKWSHFTCRHFRRLYVIRVKNKMSFMITFLISIIFRFRNFFGVYFNLNTISMQKLFVAPLKKLVTSSKQGWSMVWCVLFSAKVTEMASRELRGQLVFSVVLPL